MSQRIELLAPAGGVAALHAAVIAGANAVYLGLESFNARRGAENFTYESLSEACDYAHLRGVRVYVALNVIVLPSEIDQALETARQAYRAGADAFIVQDIGLAAELSRTLPEARLHVSTQMNTHSVAGVEAAARLGARRATLARELSMAEVARLSGAAAERGMETEVFAHGALCVCYSGQCLMSSMIGGRSANRGQCAQACRLPYTLHNKAVRKPLPAPGEHLLSPCDLQTIDVLPELARAGVSSLKIEGRMKSPDYVYAVTSAYREVLDRVLSGEEARATDGERRALAEVFSRGFTTAYLTGERGNDMMSYGRPNNRGAFVGRVLSAQDGVAIIASEHELHEGDILEFWTNRGHFAHTLDNVERDRSGAFRMVLDRAVGKGDRVFRVRNAETRFDADAFEPRIPVTGRATLRLGEPLRIEFSPAAGIAADREGAGDMTGRAEGEVVEAARTRAVDAEGVRAHVDRLGQTPYRLTSLSLDLGENVGIGFSRLHHVRAAALDDLTDHLLAPWRGRMLPKVRGRASRPPVHPRKCAIAAWVTNPACARAAKRAGADQIYVPAFAYREGEALIAGQRSATAEQVRYPKQVIVAIPAVDHDVAPGTREEQIGLDVWDFVQSGKPLYVDNLGAAVRAAGEGARIEVGSHVPVTNRLTLEYMADLGATRVWLSPELMLGQIADLAADSPVELGLTIIGAQELMITEHCLLMSQGPCDEECAVCQRRKSPHFLKDRKGYEFPVVTDAFGRSHLYNGVTLDAAHAVPDLIHAGVSAFMVDASLMNVEETAQAVARAVRARNVALSDGNAIAKAPGTTTGHLFRGVG